MRPVQAVPILIVLFLLGTGQAAQGPLAQTVEDATPCLDALGITLPLTEDRTTTCVVTYLHVSNDGTNAFDPLHEGPGRTTEIALSPHGARFALPPNIVVYGLQEKAVVEQVAPLVPIHFEETTPLHALLHLKVDDPTLPACLRLELRIDLEDDSGETKTVSEARVVGPVGSTNTSPSPLCPDDDSLAHSGDGAAALNVTFPPLSIRTVDPSARLYLNLTARTQGFDDPAVQPHGFRLVQGPDHTNHLTLPIHDAIRTTVDTTWDPARGLVLDVAVRSPLGINDILPVFADLRVVDGEGNALDRDEMIERGGPATADLACSRCSGLRLHWPLAAGVLEDGPYRAEVTTWNTQRTARLTEPVPFTISHDGNLIRTVGEGGVEDEHFMALLTDDDTTCPVSESRCTADPPATLSEAPAPVLLPWILLLLLTLARRHRRS